MPDKILGKDHDDTASPLLTHFLTLWDGSANKDVLFSSLRTLFEDNLISPEIKDTTQDHKYSILVSELTGDRTITLPLLTGHDVFVFADFIQTLTNKRVTPRTGTVTSHATPTINT